MKNIYIKDLEDLLEKELITDKMKLIIDLFLTAVNDWPKSIDNLDDYEYEVNEFIKGESTKTNIKNYLKNIDFTKYAWQSESLTGLLDVFKHYNDDLSLREIIEKLKIEI